jgi:signal transduction histidine kinase
LRAARSRAWPPCPKIASIAWSPAQPYRKHGAGDEARRRVVRDLHDGAQQRLVRAVITLKLAQRALGEDTERVDATDRRLAPEVEASAYFIVVEALTNVVKHSQAATPQVTAAVDNGKLSVEVRDDGIGWGDPEGHGLMGVSDRVAALGGRLRIDSPRGGGTVLAAELPLSAWRPD